MKTTSTRFFRTAFQAALSLVAFLHSAVAATVDVTYDHLHRVTQVTDSAPFSVAYTYDEVGNRVLRVSSTTNAGAPIAVTDTAAFSSQTTAVLSAAVNPNGSATMVWMQWGTDTSYGNTTTHQSIGSGNLTVNVTAPITGLSLGTIYHFRVVAQNTSGITYGEDVSAFSGNLAAIYTTGTEVPLITDGFTATGKTVNLALNHAPQTGTELMVVKNTGLGFINGTFNELAQGQVVALTFGGNTYNFVANYYGGSGNDLVLVWANSRPFGWGYNDSGRLGDNSTTNRLMPVSVVSTGVLAGKTVVTIAAGGYHSLALCVDGSMAAWGYNGCGQLGHNTTTDRYLPTALTIAGTPLQGKTVVAVAAGTAHSLALCSDGTLAAWGYNGAGRLGDNTTIDRHIPVAVAVAGTPLDGKMVVAIAVGGNHSMALCSDGTLVAWGINSYGKLGDNTTTDRRVPTAVVTAGTVLAGKTVVSIAAGAFHSVVLCSDGTLAAWGNNDHGRLGDNTIIERHTPVAVTTVGTPLAGKSVTTIAAGYSHSMALCSDGTLAAWGYNGFGAIGDSSTIDRHIPIAVASAGTPLDGKTVMLVAAGQNCSMAWCSDGTLAAWGNNTYGQLGDNTTTQRNRPIAVNAASLTGGERVTRIHSGAIAFHNFDIVALSQVPAPEVTVFDGNGTNGPQRQNNVGGFGFANTAVGGSSASQTFTIKNTGMADLTGLAVTKAGASLS